VVHPLVPEDYWEYFCLDNLLYRGKKITVLYDRTGKKYGKGRGLQIFVDGKLKVSSDKIERLQLNL